ncbi:MAG: ComEA family DNA-binding protein [Myxococcaceae bacterium]
MMPKPNPARPRAFTRTHALAAVLFLGLSVSWLARWQRIAAADVHLDCPPSEIVFRRIRGEAPIAMCSPVNVGEPAPVPAGVALTLEKRLDCNRASAAELAKVPGLGRTRALALVNARAGLGGRFRTWAQVDAVEGVGPKTRRRLQEACELKR